MAKEKSSPRRKEIPENPKDIISQPHDKYVKAVLQHKEMAVALLRYCVLPEIIQNIDLESLQVSEETFIDEHLKAHFSDICYSGFTKNEKPVRVTVIIEHKSKKPHTPVLEQVNRYISNSWSSDVRQGRPLSLTLPVLIYHGKQIIAKETPETLFPDTPAELLSFVPRLDYILLDIRRIPDEVLESIEYLLLQKFLMVLKHGRSAVYFEQYWKKILIFAPGFPDQVLASAIFRVTMVYLGKTLPSFNQNIKNMSDLLSSEEQTAAKPYIIQMLDHAEEKGMEKGIEKGIELLLMKFLKKNPTMSNGQVAEIFEVPLTLVQRIRVKM